MGINIGDEIFHDKKDNAHEEIHHEKIPHEGKIESNQQSAADLSIAGELFFYLRIIEDHFGLF